MDERVPSSIGLVETAAARFFFQFSKALYQVPECKLGPSFISSPTASGLLSQKRWQCWNENCHPQQCFCQSALHLGSLTNPNNTAYGVIGANTKQKSKLCWGSNLLFKKSSNRSEHQLSRHSSQGQGFHLCNRLWDILTCQ